MELELEELQALAAAYQWKVSAELDQLRVTIEFNSAVDGEVFVVEFLCDDYKAKPPLIEFIEPKSKLRGTKKAYPKGGNGYFHEDKICVCAAFSRRGYAVLNGPHSDWDMTNWMNLSPRHTTIGLIMSAFQKVVNDPKHYKGRMA